VFPLIPSRSAQLCSPLRRRLRWILLKLGHRAIHLVPRVRVCCPHISLRFEPAWVIQARSPDRDKLRHSVRFDHNRHAAVRAKAPAGHTAPFARRRMEAGRTLQEPESFRRHDYIRRKRPATGSLAIATVAVQHHHGFRYGFVANRAARATAGKRNLYGWFHS